MASDYDCGANDFKRKFPSKNNLKNKIFKIDNILDSLIKYKFDLEQCLREANRSIIVYSEKKEKYLILLSASDMNASLIDDDWDTNGTLKIEQDWDSNGTLKFDHSILSNQEQNNEITDQNMDQSTAQYIQPKKSKSSVNKWIKKSIALKNQVN
jgi:hypothetical protein